MYSQLIHPILKINLFIVILGLLFGQTACTSSMVNSDENNVFMNRIMPAFSLKNYEGEQLTSESYKGKYLVGVEVIDVYKWYFLEEIFLS